MSHEQIMVTWQEVPTTARYCLTRYFARRNNQIMVIMLSADRSNYHDNDLQPETAYSYRMDAVSEE